MPLDPVILVGEGNVDTVVTKADDIGIPVIVHVGDMAREGVLA